MGLFTSANEIRERIEKEANTMLIEGEQIERLFSMLEDFCAVTNKRILFVDKSFTSSKKSVHSVPFSKISIVSIKKGGFMEFSNEIELTIGSKSLELKMYDPKGAQELVNMIISKIV